jgi:tetratricopeptide (TPR) repeat protein
VRADADAARKDAAAPASFVLGQLEEDLGNLEAAELNYRLAIKSNQDAKGPPHDSYRYRIALARLLQRERGAAAAAPPPVPAPAKEEKADKAEEKTSSLQPASWHPLAGLVAAVVLGAQPADDEETPAQKARLDESIKLAEELLQSDDPKVRGQGHVILGEALSKRGKRTEGLREVSRGLMLLHPGLPARELDKLLAEHPAFQHPDVSKEPNPDIAEKFFGLGMHHYWERRYAEAEAQFKQAVGYFDQDARYQYFLGLAQLAQRSKLKRDQAYFSFEKGARMEAAGRPGVVEVNFSLERVQGELRQLLNEFRTRVLTKDLPE